MKIESKTSKLTQFYPLGFLFIFIAFILRLNQFSSSLFEQAQFRQTQTALTTRVFLQQGIDLLSSPLPVYGRDANLPMEMPLYQGLVAALAPSTAMIEPTGRVISFFAFALSGLLFSTVIKRWTSKSFGLTYLGIFLLTPFAFQWGGAFLIESLATLFSVVMFFAFCNWLDSYRRIWLLMGLLGSVPAFLIKPTTAALYVPALLLAFLANANPVIAFRQNLRKILVFFVAGGPLAGFLAAIAWTKHADWLKSQSDLGKMLTSEALVSWNFGTVNQRFDLENWFGIWQRLFIEIFGAIGTTFILVAIFSSLSKPKRINILFLAMIGAALLGPIIFFNLYAVHSYYLMSVYPLLIGGLLLAIRIIFNFRIVSHLPTFAKSMLVGSLLFIQVLAIFNTYESRQDISASLEINRDKPHLSKLLQESTKPGDLIVLLGCDWDPSVLYYAHREGVMLPNWLIPRGAQDAIHKLEPFRKDFKFVATCDPTIKADTYMPKGIFIKRISGDHSGVIYSKNP